MESFPYSEDEFTNAKVEKHQLIKKYNRVKLFSLKKPHWDGWVLLLPNTRVAYLDEFEPQLFADCLALGQMMHNHFIADSNYSGYKLILNRGVCAGQKIPHAHFHFIPLFNNRSDNPFSVSGKSIEEKDLQKHVQKYKNLLPNLFPPLTSGENKIKVENKEWDKISMSQIVLSGINNPLLLTQQDAFAVLKIVKDLHSKKSTQKDYCGYNFTTNHLLNGKNDLLTHYNWIPRYLDEKIDPLIHEK